MATALDLITTCLRIVGTIGFTQTPDAAESQAALQAMTLMLDSWSTEKLIIYQTASVPHVLTPGTRTYSIGTGGVINTPRPIRVNHATMTFAQIDYPVHVLDEESDYDDIGVKSTSSPIVSALYYDASWPLGEIRLYPTPSQANTLTINVDQPLVAPPTLVTVLSFPQGYEEAFKWNLTLRLFAEYGRPAPPEIQDFARGTKGAIKNKNLHPVVAKLDARLTHIGHERRGVDPGWIVRGDA